MKLLLLNSPTFCTIEPNRSYNFPATKKVLYDYPMLLIYLFTSSTQLLFYKLDSPKSFHPPSNKKKKLKHKTIWVTIITNYFLLQA